MGWTGTDNFSCSLCFTTDMATPTVIHHTSIYNYNELCLSHANVTLGVYDMLKFTFEFTKISVIRDMSDQFLPTHLSPCRLKPVRHVNSQEQIWPPSILWQNSPQPPLSDKHSLMSRNKQWTTTKYKIQNQDTEKLVQVEILHVYASLQQPRLSVRHSLMTRKIRIAQYRHEDSNTCCSWLNDWQQSNRYSYCIWYIRATWNKKVICPYIISL